MYARWVLPHRLMNDALALFELDSVASGLRVLDVLVKQAPVEILEANLVEPGKFLILFAGGVAEVDESHKAVVSDYSSAVLSSLKLPLVHSAIIDGLRGVENRLSIDTLGVVEGSNVATTLEACDRSLKDADVTLCGIRVAIGLGGRAYYVVSGTQSDVDASVDAGRTVLEKKESLHRTEVIARPHDEMLPWLLRPAPFGLVRE
jgi:microcompartment protein CcmL/EutN